MMGGPGDDVLFPGASTQTVTGDAGNDVANFFSDPLGIDTNLAGTGLETIIGTQLDDTIIGSDQNEVILGEAGNDSIQGNGGDDYIDGGSGVDTMDGGDGNDIFVNADGPDPDTVDGGAGDDFAQFGGLNGVAPHQTPVDTLINVEFIYDPDTGYTWSLLRRRCSALLAAPDAVTISNGGSLSGGLLSISGQSKNGSPIADNISVILDSTGKNISVTQNGVSKTYALASVTGISIDSGGGNDTIALQKSDGTRAITIPVTVLGGSGNDTIIGGAAGDFLDGGDGNDSLHGEGGNDSLQGRSRQRHPQRRRRR